MATKAQTKAAKKPVAKKAVAKKPKQGNSQDAAKARKANFVEAYIANGGNATEAAKAAGYSAKTAYSQGGRLLKNVEIQRSIAERAQKVANKYELTTELVVKSIVQELKFDPANLYQAGGQLKDITELDEDTRMALASVEFEQMGSQDAPVFVRKFKWAPRQGAREQAMKHLGMFKKDNEQQPSPTFILMEQITSSPNSRIKVK